MTTARSHLHVPVAAGVLLAVVALTACHAPTAEPVVASLSPPAPDASKPEHYPGLHNVVTYHPGLYSGGMPEGSEGLRSLQAMGIRTIVSVDGATPDVAGAEALGLRYVHLPISYDTVPAERQLQLVQTLSSCEGPIYVHCHHGKHRSAAALGSALVACGMLTPEAAHERMQVSGTAKDYKGLWKAVAEAKAIPAAQRKVDPATLPKVTKVSGMVATMAEIDLVIDLVKATHQAGWKPPANHPDLVPVKETARLAKLYRDLRDDPESRQLPDEYQRLLQKSIDATAALDAAVRRNDAAAAEQHLNAVTKGCKECHVLYRDQ
jgi:protein tyrosine phosphatase (PTP) superfamily phosphohydrolase (DUF442 family)